jgi:phosphatidylglycerol lysyltransferase
MKRFLHIFGRLLIVAVFLGAAWLLYGQLQKYTWEQVREALTNMPAGHVALAVLLTLLNYAILVGYDWFAVRWVGARDLPVRKIAMASFTGYVFSYNFGATLFGTSIRYRLYSAWGMPLLKILDLLVILGLTFWFGVFTLAGIVFMAKPFPIPAGLKLPFNATFWVGAVLLLVAAGYVALAGLRRRPLKLFGWQIPLPPLKLTLYQIVIACADLMVAAAVLYVLLPPVEGGYLRVLGVFMLAFVVAILTHVPGGYGVFDFTMMQFLPEEPSVLAALLVFRVIYYWAPLFIAGAMLGYHELTLKGEPEKG